MTWTGRYGATDELLDGILAAPDDDAPRLVYGDWLTERGHPLGELIQLQCSVAASRLTGAQPRFRPDPDDFWGDAALRWRLEELWKQHQKTWLAPLHKHLRTWSVRRGFVDHVLADLGAFLDGFEALARVPLLSASLRQLKPALAARLQTTPAHPTLRRLELEYGAVNARRAEALTGPFFARTELLILQGSPLGERGLEWLAAASFPALTRLQIDRTQATTTGVRALARSRWWSQLTHLDLRSNPLDGDVLDALAAARGLELLYLDGGGLTAAHLARLDLPRLEVLDVGALPLTEADLAAIVQNPGLPRLRQLDHQTLAVPAAAAARLRERRGAGKDVFNFEVFDVKRR